MTPKLKAKFADYLSKGIRESMKDTGLKWPKDTILVVKSYGELADLNEIIGMKVYIMDMPSSYDFFVAFPSCNNDRLQKAFLEYLDTNYSSW